MRLFLLSLIPVTTLMSAAAVTTGQNEPLPGKVPYERVCAACHGENAQGDQGPKLTPMTLEYEEILAKVRQGGGEMPVISKTKMSDEEVKQVLEYLKSL
jgi:mono/diheme cytochrome c family protein